MDVLVGKMEAQIMKIWVDADACPVVIKEILYRAAKRTEIVTTFVANKVFRLPRSPFLKFLKVDSGFDKADNEIVKRVNTGDLVITGDIPLASEVIEKGCTALNPRGTLYSRDNIKSRLYMRDFMATLRSSGIETGGPSPMSQKDRQKFANQLDMLLLKAGNA